MSRLPIFTQRTIIVFFSSSKISGDSANAGRLFYLVQNKLVSWLKESEEMAILSKRLFLSNVVEKGSSYQPLANIFPVFRHRSNSFA